MDKKDALKNIPLFIEAVVNEYNPSQIILYGSFARGTQSENSDIDIAVVMDKIEGSFLDKESGLYKIRRNIDSNIEPILLESSSDNMDFLNIFLAMEKYCIRTNQFDRNHN